MRELFGEEFIVNTHHHQSVKECAPGFRVTAVTDEGVIEAIEHESLPIIGTQWHPELSYRMNDPVEMKLFENFFETCRKVAGK